VVHRRDDGAYLALQVKGITTLHGAEAPIEVFENHLFTSDQMIIGVHLDGDWLGQFAMVVDAATFKQKAARIDDRGRVRLVADMPMHPIPSHKWSEDLVPIDKLADRLAARRGAAAALPARELVSDEDRVVGFWGEQEVCLRLSMLEDCGLFRPFPDNETAEIVLRRLATGSTLGIQVKSSQLDEQRASRKFYVYRPSFVASPTTYLVALAWVVPDHRFHETCLVIPTEDLPSIAAKDGPYFAFHFRPARSRSSSRLDRYRVPLDSLADVFSTKLLGLS
jgi:hypothetical protein